MFQFSVDQFSNSLAQGHAIWMLGMQVIGSAPTLPFLAQKAGTSEKSACLRIIGLFLLRKKKAKQKIVGEVVTGS